jgi:DNA-binding transcriptional regulator YiaG
MRDWTGREAVALRKALRLTQGSFARKLGASVRTVAHWASYPDTVPRSAAQDTLDELLAGASPAARTRFEQLTAGGPVESAGEDGDRYIVVSDRAPVVSLAAHPCYAADYKALAIGQVIAARAELDLTPGEFVAWLGSVLGRPLREECVSHWERGIMPPADAVMASLAVLAEAKAVSPFGRKSQRRRDHDA